MRPCIYFQMQSIRRITRLACTILSKLLTHETRLNKSRVARADFQNGNHARAINGF